MSSGPEFKIALSLEPLKYYKKVSASTAKRLDRCFIKLEKAPLNGPGIIPLREMAGKYM
jgi:hypothetical protein